MRKYTHERALDQKWQEKEQDDPEEQIKLWNFIIIFPKGITNSFLTVVRFPEYVLPEFELCSISVSTALDQDKETTSNYNWKSL